MSPKRMCRARDHADNVIDSISSQASRSSRSWLTLLSWLSIVDRRYTGHLLQQSKHVRCCSDSDFYHESPTDDMCLLWGGLIYAYGSYAGNMVFHETKRNYCGVSTSSITVSAAGAHARE
jgi:hypothetical protein